MMGMLMMIMPAFSTGSCPEEGSDAEGSGYEDDAFAGTGGDDCYDC